MKNLILIISILFCSVCSSQTVLSTLNTASPSSNVKFNLPKITPVTNTNTIVNYQNLNFYQTQTFETNFQIITPNVENTFTPLNFLLIRPVYPQIKKVDYPKPRSILMEFLNSNKKDDKK